MRKRMKIVRDVFAEANEWNGETKKINLIGE
jgi:hypothetical protein